MEGCLFIEFTTPPRCACQVISQKFSKNPPLGTRQKKQNKNIFSLAFLLDVWYSYYMTAKQELQEFDGQEIIFEIFPEDCPNQVEQGILSFDADENAIVTFSDGETMSIKARQVIDTFDNWSKENFS